METIEIKKEEILNIIVAAGNMEMEDNTGYAYLRGIMLGLITRIKTNNAYKVGGY